MMKMTTRKIAIIATMVFACVAFTACAGTGNDEGVQPKEIVATKAVVTTAAETEATTTTTEAIEDSEPEATKTTTTEASSSSETKPEVTTTEVNVDEKYLSVEECLEKLVRENYNKEIIGISESETGTFSINTSDNDVLSFYMDKDLYYSGEKVNIDNFVVQDNGFIWYNDK